MKIKLKWSKKGLWHTDLERKGCRLHHLVGLSFVTFNKEKDGKSVSATLVHLHIFKFAISILYNVSTKESEVSLEENKTSYWPDFDPSSGRPTDKILEDVYVYGTDMNLFFPIFFSDGGFIEEIVVSCSSCGKPVNESKAVARCDGPDRTMLWVAHICNSCNTAGIEYLEVLMDSSKEGPLPSNKYLKQYLADGTYKICQLKRE